MAAAELWAGAAVQLIARSSLNRSAHFRGNSRSRSRERCSIGSIRIEKRLDPVVTLQEWDSVEEIERVGMERQTYEILGMKVPHITIPVRPGRDIARLIEVAAMDTKLKGLGQNSAVDFNAKLLNLMERTNGPA